MLSQKKLLLYKTRPQGHTVLNCSPLPVFPIQVQVACARSHVCVLWPNGQMQRHMRHTETTSLGKPSCRGDYRRIYLIGKRHSHGWGCRTRTHTCLHFSQPDLFGNHSDDGCAHGKTAARKLTHQSTRSKVLNPTPTRQSEGGKLQPCAARTPP